MPAQIGRVEALEKSLDSEILSLWIRQRRDSVSVDASHPLFNGAAASKFATITGDVLFIALANGGIGPGMDVFLRCENVEPKLTEEEKTFLIGEAKNKAHVVIYDEDSFTGDTMRIAGDYFVDLLGKETYVLYNMRSSGDGAFVWHTPETLRTG